MKKIIENLMYEKCPNCGEGRVFENPGNVLLFKVPKMNEHCPQCGHRFEKEPGYFTGAMYVSYGLCIVEMFILCSFSILIGISIDYMMYALITLVVLLWTFNFRKSRVIWMNLV